MRALDAGVAAILTVHRSNFEQRGFVATPSPAELAAARPRGRRSLPLRRRQRAAAGLSPWGLTGEPRVAERWPPAPIS